VTMASAEYYVRLLRDSFATRLARAFTPYDFRRCSRIPISVAFFRVARQRQDGMTKPGAGRALSSVRRVIPRSGRQSPGAQARG
jgi:hypothetical protein